MSDNSLVMILRAKKLGVLVQDARLAAGKSMAQCAQVMDITEAELEAIELGERSPSLPQLELLAYFLEIPLDHFWGSQALSERERDSEQVDGEQLIELRQRMIGTQLRQTRLDLGLSQEEVAGQIGVSPRELEAFELGEMALPLPLLEVMTNYYKQPVKAYHDVHGPVGIWIRQQRVIDDFLNLSPEMQNFVSKPVNQPYLELAQRLSEMSVEKLRAVAEGLLEITL